MSFVTHASNKDASAFKTQVEERLAEKVVMVLEALKVEVASNLFSEEGGVSGGVSSVTKKPAPPAAGSVKLPPAKEDGKVAEGDRDMVSQGGNRQTVKSLKMPGQNTVKEGTTSDEPNSKGDRIKAVQKDKKPNLPTKKDFKKDGVDKE